VPIQRAETYIQIVKREGTSRAALAWLQSQLPLWREEGLIDERTAERIADRYRGDHVERVSRVVFFIYLIGFVLIGGGVLSFVAWNWDDMPPALKLGLSGLALVVTYAAGFWYWKVDGRRAALGHSLTVLGSLLFGANIGVVAQVFQLSSQDLTAVGIWGAGVTLAAWLLSSAPNAVLANFLLAAWALDRIDALGPGLASGLPAIAIIPLAFRLSSAPLYAVSLATAAFMLAAEVVESRFGVEPAIASVLASACLFLAIPLVLPSTKRVFRAISTHFGFYIVLALAYAFSFHEVAHEIDFDWDEASGWLGFVLPQFLAAVACVLFAGAKQPEALRRELFGMIALGLAVLLFAGMQFSEPEIPLAVVANLGLLAIGAYSIARSLRELRRWSYWGGIVLIAAAAVSRFVEFETGLLAKAFFFTACGVTVIYAGLAFEKRVDAREPSHAA